MARDHHDGWGVTRPPRRAQVSSLLAAAITLRIDDEAVGLRCGPCCVLARAHDEGAETGGVQGDGEGPKLTSGDGARRAPTTDRRGADAAIAAI